MLNYVTSISSISSDDESMKLGDVENDFYQENSHGKVHKPYKMVNQKKNCFCENLLCGNNCYIFVIILLFSITTSFFVKLMVYLAIGTTLCSIGKITSTNLFGFCDLIIFFICLFFITMSYFLGNKYSGYLFIKLLIDKK